jgi:hypothetical protein
MSDKELLELAAEAAGMDHMRWAGASGLHRMLDPSRPKTTGSIGPTWNPLTDDGDALRLAVKLNMEVRVDYMTDSTIVTSHEQGRYDYVQRAMEDHGADPYAATRRAIVRAAASIRRAGKES